MKLDEALKARDVSKARYLELRKQISEKAELLQKLAVELQSDRATLEREQGKLVELTTLTIKLLHSDLSGLTGAGSGAGSGSASAEVRAA